VRAGGFKGALLVALITVSLMVLAISLLSVSQASAQPLGMIGYWTFDDGTAKDTVGTNDGTIYGATWTTGIVNGALSFDGVDDCVNVPHHPSLNFYSEDSFTIEALVKTSTLGSIQSIVTKQDAVESYSLRIDANGKAQFFLKDSNAIPLSVNGVSNIANNSWHHVVGVRDHTENKIKIYVDGTIEISVIDTLTGGFDSYGDLGIGYSGYGNWWYFNGLIDEVAIYHRALTASEIQQHYQNCLKGLGYTAPPPARPVGGIAFPPDKLALLAPYIVLVALIAIVSVSVAVYWRRHRA